MPRNISKAVEMLGEIAGKGSAVGQQVTSYIIIYPIIITLLLNLILAQYVGCMSYEPGTVEPRFN